MQKRQGRSNPEQGTLKRGQVLMIQSSNQKERVALLILKNKKDVYS